jgi:DNA-binding NtrC family response regulator
MLQPFERDIRRGSSATVEPKTGIDCVFLTCLDDDFDLFGGLLRVSGIRLHRADTVEVADFLLTVTEATVLLSDMLFLDGAWDTAADMIGSFHPGVSLLIALDERTSELPSGALRRAVYELVSRPMRLTPLRQAIQAAHRASQKSRA